MSFYLLAHAKRLKEDGEYLSSGSLALHLFQTLQLTWLQNFGQMALCFAASAPTQGVVYKVGAAAIYGGTNINNRWLSVVWRDEGRLMNVNGNTAKRQWFKPTLYVVVAALVVWVGFFLASKVFKITDFVGDFFSSTKEAAGELLSLGGERVINPTELHEYYTVVINGKEVLGMGYGLFHATGFVFIDGPGLADNENVILRDAVYLGQTTVSSKNVEFEIVGENLVVALPESEYFGTTLAVEPTIENPAEFMAKLGQLFGSQTNTKPFRDELKQAVTEQIVSENDLFLMAECMAASTIVHNVLPGFTQIHGLEMPNITVINSQNVEINSALCNSIDTSYTPTTMKGLLVDLDSTGRISDTELGDIHISGG